MQMQEHVREHELGNLLRYWRHQRGKSQLDLSLDTGISQRHLSFVESGRSVPSRDLLSIVSEKLDIPGVAGSEQQDIPLAQQRSRSAAIRGHSGRRCLGSCRSKGEIDASRNP